MPRILQRFRSFRYSHMGATDEPGSGRDLNEARQPTAWGAPSIRPAAVAVT